MSSEVCRIESDIEVWWDDGINLRAVSPYCDPVDMAEESALALAEQLRRLVRTAPAPAESPERPASVEALLVARRSAAAGIYVFAIGEHVILWNDGTPCLRAATTAGAPVVLSRHAALDLAAALIRVAGATVLPDRQC